MFTVCKKEHREPKSEVLSIRITKSVHDALFRFANNYDFDIHDSIRTYLEDMLVPALEKAARAEDSKLLSIGKKNVPIDKPS